MAALKTQKNKASVSAFLAAVEDETKRKDCQVIMNMMREITGEKPAMWGTSMVGFGSYHYTYASGREGDWPVTGFSPRKQNLTIYLMDGCKRHGALLKKLGKHTTGSSCLYIKSLDSVDQAVLRKLIEASVANKRG